MPVQQLLAELEVALINETTGQMDKTPHHTARESTLDARIRKLRRSPPKGQNEDSGVQHISRCVDALPCCNALFQLGCHAGLHNEPIVMTFRRLGGNFVSLPNASGRMDEFVSFFKVVAQIDSPRRTENLEVSVRQSL